MEKGSLPALQPAELLAAFVATKHCCGMLFGTSVLGLTFPFEDWVGWNVGGQNTPPGCLVCLVAVASSWSFDEDSVRYIDSPEAADLCSDSCQSTEDGSNDEEQATTTVLTCITRRARPSCTCVARFVSASRRSRSTAEAFTRAG